MMTMTSLKWMTSSILTVRVRSRYHSTQPTAVTWAMSVLSANGAHAARAPLGCRLSRLEARLVRLQLYGTLPMLSGKGKSKKRKSGSKRKMKVTGIPAASSFAVLLEESGVYEDKLPEPHYLSVETEAAKTASPRTFCQVCGNFSKYRCTRCREPYCSLKCYKTHNELRCLKFAL